MGVAPLASFIIGDYNMKGSETYLQDWWADFFDSARTNGAAVANMSFGSNTVDADDIDTYMTNNSVNAATAYAYYMSSSATSINTWVTAMNNFQSSGGSNGNGGVIIQPYQTQQL